ncbi:histidine phosphatase family protein [Candidatus Roizmanbacteria bacterium]|nr:histidine phosphatase family protein [Candidatus Roizmanbacteria bacterium]
MPFNFDPNLQLVFIRHGIPINSNVIAGYTPGSEFDFPISRDGYSRIKALGNSLRSKHGNPAVMIYSPLQRTFQTAQAINEAYGKTIPMEENYGLIDVQGHSLVGQSVEKFQDIQQGRISANAEHPNSIVPRMLAVVEIAIRNHPGHTIFFVSHTEPIAEVLGKILKGVIGVGLPEYFLNRGQTYLVEYSSHGELLQAKKYLSAPGEGGFDPERGQY